METDKLKKLIELRTMLIKDFEKRRDYKSNKNAIMREIDHAELLHETIKRIDGILEGTVTFS
mgnify:CR=1 FL=1